MVITLHDINGNRLMELASAGNKSKGEHNISLSLGQVPSGIYLIAIQTERGEQAVQRLIVE